jgi:NTE family protein
MRALVLSGGGSRGAYQVGVLQKVMKDEGRDYDILCGVSVGALNTAGLAQFKLGDSKAAWEWLHQLWLGINTKKIYKKWAFWPLSVPSKASVFNTAPLRDLVTKTLNEEAVRASGRKLRIGAVSWETGEYTLATETSTNLAWWVLASSSYPVMFEPIRVGGEVRTDGGARNVTPLAAALELGATEIDVIMSADPDVRGSWDPKGKFSYDYLFRYLSVSGDEIMRNDLRCLGIDNPFVEPKPEYKNVKIRVQKPRHSMTKFDSLSFDPEMIREMIKLGHKEAYEENF